MSLITWIAFALSFSVSEHLPEGHRLCAAHMKLLSAYAAITADSIPRMRHGDYAELDRQVTALLSLQSRQQIRQSFGQRRRTPRIRFKPQRDELQKAMDWEFFVDRRDLIFQLISAQQRQLIEASQLRPEVVELLTQWEEKHLEGALREALDDRWQRASEAAEFPEFEAVSSIQETEREEIQKWIQWQENVSSALGAYRELDEGQRHNWYSIHAFDFKNFNEFILFVLEFIPELREVLDFDTPKRMSASNFQIPHNRAVIYRLLEALTISTLDRLLHAGNTVVIRPRRKRDGDLYVASTVIQIRIYLESDGSVKQIKMSPFDSQLAWRLSLQRRRSTTSQTRLVISPDPSGSDLSSTKPSKPPPSQAKSSEDYIPPLNELSGVDAIDSELNKILREHPDWRGLLENEIVPMVQEASDIFDSDFSSRFLKNLNAYLKRDIPANKPGWLIELRELIANKKLSVSNEAKSKARQQDAEFGTLRKYASDDAPLDEIKAGVVYTIRFDRQPGLDFQRVMFSPSVRDFLAEEAVNKTDGKNWVKAFSHGVVAARGAAGIKRLTQSGRGNSNRYEIKIMGRNERIFGFVNEDGIWEFTEVFDDHR